MKICPRCGKTYPDDERFCDTDGTALVTAASGARQTTVMPDPQGGGDAPGVIECPECGGRAEPGETICNFCGTRLLPDAAGAAQAGAAALGEGGAGHGMNPEDYVPAADRDQSFGGDPDYRPSNPEDYPEYPDQPLEKRGLFGAIGYVIAALIALVVGASLALYLSFRHESVPPVAQASPSPSPALTAEEAGPAVELAHNLQIQIKGPDLAAALRRDSASARSVFENNKAGLLDVYKQALGGDASLHDGMIVRLHVNPDGTVGGGGVVVSTAMNPSLDAVVVSTMSTWKFAPASGAPVDIDYPVIFAVKPADMAGIESGLNTEMASVGPSEAPEYTSSPAGTATPAVAMAVPPSPAAYPPSPPPALLPPPAAPPPARHKRSHRPPAAKAPPKPPLGERVAAELHANRRTRRVQAYASPGGTVTLSGSVFDEKDKAYAERTARRVSGVTAVINNLTVQTAQWAVNQNRIQQELQNAGLTGVTVKVIGDDAYLDGEVKTALDKQRAVTITMSAAPVKVAGNLIRVAPGKVFGF